MTDATSTTPPGIVPRWEWRTFGAPFARAEEVLGGLAPERVQESDEIYLLSVHGDRSVKIRDELMDVKQLNDVNEHGLELWIPVMKATFPLSADDTAAVLSALGVTARSDLRASYALDEVERELVDPDPDLRSARVHKRRARYTVDECMVELTDVRANGSTTQTMAFESPDAELVWATVRKFGLDGRRNVSVARGLKALLGFGTRRGAVIDVGTNSVKFYLGDVSADGAVRPVVDRAEVTRLGEGLSEAIGLAEGPMQRTADAIATMADEARRAGADHIVAVGTAGLRLAPNRDDFVEAVRQRSGISIEVISGEDEARLAYLAATSALPSARGRLVVYDSGGGSTQFTFGQGQKVDDRFSLDVGAVRIAEAYGLAAAVSEEVLQSALEGVATELSRLDDQSRPDALLGIGGTTTNLAAVKHALATYDPNVVQGTVLDLGEIDRQIELYRTRSADERRQIVGLQPARADVILAGACIVRTILTRLDQTSLTVSDRGLRHGVFVERFGA